jgi:hypothetical protein
LDKRILACRIPIPLKQNKIAAGVYPSTDRLSRLVMKEEVVLEVLSTRGNP